MKSNFAELWNGSRAFRTIFVKNGLFLSENKADVGEAEVRWSYRYPFLLWDFCGHDGCGRIVLQGERCQKHRPKGCMPTWRWHSGLLYRYMSVPYFIGDKGSNGGRIKQYEAYRLHVWKKTNGNVPDGYVIYYEDGNPFNLKSENLILISKPMICAVKAKEISVENALLFDDILGEAIGQSYSRGRRSRWVYDYGQIAKAAGIRRTRVRQEASRGNFDPGDLASVFDFIQRMRGGCDGSLSERQKIG